MSQEGSGKERHPQSVVLDVLYKPDFRTAWQPHKLIGDQLAALQRLVGGYIECVRASALAVDHEQAPRGLFFVVNEEGEPLGFPINCKGLRGPIIALRCNDNGENASLTPEMETWVQKFVW